MFAASVALDSLLLHYRDKDGYQRRLTFLLADVHRRLEVPSVDSSNVLGFAEDCRNLF